MESLIKTDNIISQTSGSELALIEDIKKDPNIEYYYKATLTENNLPQELVDLCRDYYECVDSFSMILADEIEDKIKNYKLRLKRNNVKIFGLEIKENYVTFFIKYPTVDGFIDDYR